jgi:hypothetical protein
MPRGDGTGPMGFGPMTGRAAGYCAGYGVPGFMNAIPGRPLRAAGYAPYGPGYATPYAQGAAMPYGPGYAPAAYGAPYAPAFAGRGGFGPGFGFGRGRGGQGRGFRGGRGRGRGAGWGFGPAW